jgi:hypothetical protein
VISSATAPCLLMESFGNGKPRVKVPVLALSVFLRGVS